MERNSEQYFGVLRFGFPVIVGILSALVSGTSPTAPGYVEIRSGLVKYISIFTRPKTSCRHRKAPERRSSANYTENGKTKEEIPRIDNWRDTQPQQCPRTSESLHRVLPQWHKWELDLRFPFPRHVMEAPKMRRESRGSRVRMLRLTTFLTAVQKSFPEVLPSYTLFSFLFLYIFAGREKCQPSQ